MVKRFFIFLFVTLVFLTCVPLRPAYAAWKELTPEAFGNATSGEKQNSESSIFFETQAAMFTGTCLMGGYACPGGMADASKYFQKSALGYLSNTIALTFISKPADFGVWLADTGHTLGFIRKPAYAQGVGFSGMLPLLPIWKVFRNVAYLLLAAVMVALGFMIMFRKKIDPKTVVTAQNAIPRVVIALILITFSYAIVGVVIDLMYVVTALIVVIFRATNYLPNGQEVISTGHLFKSIFMTEFNPLRILLGYNADTATAGWTTGLIAAITGLAGIMYPAFFIITVVSAIVPLLFYIALLYLYIRLFAFFWMTYIQIILSLLLAPLQFLFECFPGSTAFSSWFKNLLANIAVFPIAAAMFMLSQIFQEVSKSQVPAWSTDTTAIWAPPYVGFSTTTTAIASLISLGLLFAIPQVAGSVKEALKAKPAMPMMDFGGAGGSAMNMLSQFYYLKMIAPSGLMKKLFPSREDKPHG